MRPARLPPARAGPSLRRGIGPFFLRRARCRASRRGASRLRCSRSRHRPPASRRPAGPRVRLGADAPSPGARPSFLSSHGPSVLSASARRSANGMSPPRFARRHRQFLRVSLPHRIERHQQVIAYRFVRQLFDPFSSSDVPIGNGVWPGIVRSYGQKVRAPARSDDRAPGSIPPGAASPRPAPRSPLRGLRLSGDDPWRLRSLSLAARLRLRAARSVHDRRRGSVAPLPSPAALPNAFSTRIAARRFAPPPLAPLSPPFGGSPSPRPRNRLGADAPSP